MSTHGGVHFLLHLSSVFSSQLLPPFGGCLHPSLPSSFCTSCCMFITASVLCGPSAAALTFSQFCPTIRKRKSRLPLFPKACLALGCLALFLLSFSFSPFFTNRLMMISLHCFHHPLFLCFAFFFFPFFLFFFLHLSFFYFSELATCPPCGLCL